MKEPEKEESPKNSPLGDGGGLGSIFIIADDFTGAAELAGISLRYGLTLPIYLNDEENSGSLNNSPEQGPDFLSGGDGGRLGGAIISTDSRSLNKLAAEKITAGAVKNIMQLKPAFLYKKIDSVLRGHVLDEIKVQMKVAGFDKVLVLAANPSLGRTISNGEYFIGGKRITETAFVNDPEFPVSSSFVLNMLGNNGVQVFKYTDTLPEQGIVIGEAVSNEEITAWASVIDETWMLVGAGDFYTALLNKKYKPLPQPHVELQSPHLYICGTAFNERKLQLRKLQKEITCVSYLPETMNDEWLANTSKIVREQKKAVIAIDETTDSALSLRQQMAKAVKDIVERETVKEIFIEGGSTAAAVLKELKISMLTPVNELQRGVVRMKAKDLWITVKPGSYELPEEILKHYFTK